MWCDSSLASSVAAVATVLIFLKGAKVMRGHEQMSFLVRMLYEIIKDMRGFLLIQFGAVGSSAFAYRLHLNPGLLVYLIYLVMSHHALQRSQSGSVSLRGTANSMPTSVLLC